MKRGEIIAGILPGDYGKPRPVVIIQSNRFAKIDSVLVCPLTSDLDGYGDFRLRLDPDEINGLKKTSDVMAEKLTAISRGKCREKIGTLTNEEIDRLTGLLAVLLGFLD